MCGICGFLASGLDDRAAATLEAMVDQLRHRGPDDAGIWLDPAAGVALGPHPSGRGRSLACRPSADAQRRRALGDQLQWRDLQRGRAARRSVGAGFAAARPLRHRDPGRGDRGLGRGGRAGACQRHVRVRALGPADAAPDPGPRPDRQEAAILWPLRSASCCSRPSSRRCARIPPSRRRSTGMRWRSSCASAGCPDRARSIAACSSCRRARSWSWGRMMRHWRSRSPTGRRAIRRKRWPSTRSPARSTRRRRRSRSC